MKQTIHREILVSSHYCINLDLFELVAFLKENVTHLSYSFVSTWIFGLFPFLAIINKAVMKIHFQVLGEQKLLFPYDKYSGFQFQGYIVITYFRRNCQSTFSKYLNHFTFSLAICFGFLHPHQH